MLVWREGKGWQGPYQVQTVDQTNTTVTINNIPKTFRTTHCKPFHRDPAETQEPHDADERTPQDQPNPDPAAHDNRTGDGIDSRNSRASRDERHGDDLKARAQEVDDEKSKERSEDG
ncbi:hypothetical protein MCOR33_011772 [Pyricularia grisea]|uniref:Hypervirulence associated protein TUDOR domain-containing protein n=1 Tax=Pyricularia grisea TaxID=148305 RepID=A0ABQ8N1L7_PYRGI|nr:hypothetical protein MCOR33_011772 [Pyricularia grisea]